MNIYNLYQYYLFIEKKVMDVLMAMWIWGISIDLKQVEEVEHRLLKAIEDTKSKALLELLQYLNGQDKSNTELMEAYRTLGNNFMNFNADAQIGYILFDVMKCTPTKFTPKKNAPSVSGAVLETLAAEGNKFAAAVQEYKYLNQFLNTFVKNVKKVNKTSRLQTVYKQLTRTGRTSSTDPNLQNIPAKDDVWYIRRVFIAEPHKTLVDADYSQIELRVLALLANEESMLQAIHEGVDLHCFSAALINKQPLDEYLEAERRKDAGLPLSEKDELRRKERNASKTTTFAIIYGESTRVTAIRLGMEISRAVEFKTKYMNTFKNVKKFVNDTIKTASKHGYVCTLFGRRRWLFKLAYNMDDKGDEARQAVNTVIQGTAAEILKLSLIALYEDIIKGVVPVESNTKIVLQVHDEIIIETQEDYAELVSAWLSNTMMHIVRRFAGKDLKVPLKADAKIGTSWYEIK